MTRRITSIIMAVLVLAASLLMPMTGILAGANTENILQTWDFGGFENGNHTGMETHHSDTRIREWFPSIGAYTTEKSKLTSADGKVVLGSNNAYWNLAKYWNINKGSLTFNSAKYSSDRHAFVMSFKLDKDLKANMEYTLNTDMTLSLTGDWFQNFCVYYADTLAKASSEAATLGKAPDGTTTLFSKYSPMGNIPAQSFTFTPAADLAAGGYLSIRFFVKAPTTLTVNIKTVQLLDVTQGSNQGGETPPPSGDDSDDTETKPNEWNFGGFDNGTYAGDNVKKEFASKDGRVVLGIDNAWWQQWKTWTVQNGNMSFTSQKYASGYHQFVLSFKLDETLKKDTDYKLETDLVLGKITGANAPKEFYVYYSPTKDNLQRASAKPTVNGHYIISEIAGGFTSLDSEFTFKPTTDLAKDGYITIRFNLTSVEPVTLTMSKAAIKEVTSQGGGSGDGDNEGGEGGNQGGGEGGNTTPDDDVILDDSFAGYWNFKGFAEGDYKGDNVVKEYASNDGKVIMGINNAWWQQWKTFNIKDSKMTFTSQKYSSGHHQFVLSLRLDTDLKAGIQYRLDTDMAMGQITGANSPKEFYVYYSPTKDNLQRATAKPTVDGHFIIHETAGGFSTLPATSFEFTPTSDLAKGGYIHIRFNLTSVEPVTVTMSEAWILKLDPNEKNKVVNGSFELSTRLWKSDAEFASTNTDAKEGKNSVKAESGYYKKLYQKVGVEPNKNYEFSFWYKGNVPENSSVWAVSTNETFKAESVLTRGTVASAEEWTQFKTVFSSGENSAVNLIFQTVPNTQMLIDGVSLVETDGEVSEYKAGVSPVITFANAQRTGYSSTIEVTDAEYNKAVNFSLENESTNAPNDFVTASGNAVKIVDTKAYEGSKSLEVTAGEELEMLSVPLKLEPETEYFFTFLINAKATKWETDNSKFTNLTFGIADKHTGEYVLMPDAKTFVTSLNSALQFVVPAYDGEWHITSFRFKTDSNGEALFLVKARNVIAYFDNFYIFEPEYRRDFKTPAYMLEDMEITNENPTMLGITDEKYNLVENSDMSAKETFWDNTKSTVLGDTLEVADSKHNIQKESFHYESNRRYPFEATYIRWVDVKPNTEYTFSAKLLISEIGKGYFGLAQGHKTDKYTVTDNLVSPTKLKLYYFTEDNFDYNCNWQNIGFTFNTKNRNRVGIVLSDAGGEAYVDDIKLFETKYSAKLKEINDNFPSDLVSNDKSIIINGNYIYGISPQTPISGVLESFCNKKYVRVFDVNGNELSDLSAGYVSTGIELRLMNGPVIKDRATIIIKGDINGDGLVNKVDKKSILKHLTVEETIDTDCYLKAADYDSDGKITIHDALFNSKEPKIGNGKITVTGPEVFDSGDEIKVKIAVNEANVRALNGKLRFNEGKLTFVSIETNVSGWEVSYISNSRELFFAAASMDSNTLEKEGDVITLTFKVGNITSYSDAAIEIYEMFLASSGKLLSSNAVWDNSYDPDSGFDSTESDSENNINVSGDNQSSTITHTVTTPGQTITTVVEESVEVKNRLSMLKLDEAEIVPEFDPEIQEYTATVPFKVEKVTVTAIAESGDATVNIGDTNLEFVGKNKVDIVVLSAEGMQRTYRIIITREAPTSTEADSGFPTWAIILICVGGALLIAGGTFVVIMLVKRKKVQKKV